MEDILASVNTEQKELGKFQFIETNPDGNVIMLLHGLFGALSNFKDILQMFGAKYNVVIPILPIYTAPLKEAGLKGLLDYVSDFISAKGYNKVNLLGNSLGGHIAQLYTLYHPEKVKSLVLTGSSGLFENTLGKNTFLKRGDYNFIKKNAEETFFDPSVATKDLVDEVFEIVNNREKAIRVIATAKSAIRHNLEDRLHKIKCPTLLVWGKEDHITPPFVAEKFHELINTSKLVFLNQCGHAPMMEKPREFNEHLAAFLEVHAEG